MERSKGLKQGLRAAATALFLAAALMSTGCGQNALVNPVTDQSGQGQNSYNTVTQPSNPVTQPSNP